jgi:hypothetical protein
MKITVDGHTRKYGQQTLVDATTGTGSKGVHWDDSRQVLRVTLVCDQDALGKGSRHDMHIELSVRELAELFGLLVLGVGEDRSALGPMAQMVAQVISGGPSKGPPIFWDLGEARQRLPVVDRVSERSSAMRRGSA